MGIQTGELWLGLPRQLGSELSAHTPGVVDGHPIWPMGAAGHTLAGLAFVLLPLALHSKTQGQEDRGRRERERKRERERE